MPIRNAVLPIIAIVGLAIMSITAAAADDTRTISVSATGSVEAEPDSAIFSTGVVTEAQSAREALDANSKRMINVVDGLKSIGIAARDIQTSRFNVQPRYSNSKTSSSSRDGTPSINGYQVTNTVRIVVRNLPRLGEIIDKTVSLGANQASGIQFVVSNAETLLDKARQVAVENAARRAKLYATAAGVVIEKVRSISESVAEHGPRPMMYSRAAAAAAVPIEAGTETLTTTIHVVYELK